MEPIYAKCDKSCGHKFYLQHFKVDKLHDTIEKTYFNCPNCGREYICFYTDKSIRKLQSKMRELHRKMKWATGDDLTKLKDSEAKLKLKIKNQMDILKQNAKSDGTTKSNGN